MLGRAISSHEKTIICRRAESYLWELLGNSAISAAAALKSFCFAAISVCHCDAPGAQFIGACCEKVTIAPATFRLSNARRVEGSIVRSRGRCLSPYLLSGRPNHARPCGESAKETPCFPSLLSEPPPLASSRLSLWLLEPPRRLCPFLSRRPPRARSFRSGAAAAPTDIAAPGEDAALADNGIIAPITVLAPITIAPGLTTGLDTGGRAVVTGKQMARWEPPPRRPLKVRQHLKLK